jgi:alkanesulfonate monooxygenase SsuD/methylene tetrahydromethanopterin reductase-like flavin-dependent oxidoreductase (luciferase family)
MEKLARRGSVASMSTPPHVAARLAFLDHLAKGRLNLAFGPGSVTADQELYGLDPKDAAAMTEAAVEVILKLWASDPPTEIGGAGSPKDSPDPRGQPPHLHRVGVTHSTSAWPEA